MSETHPLRSGLRIGKVGDEDEPSGDGDRQYHHRLTAQIFALNSMTHTLHDMHYMNLAIERECA